eukprot:m.65865 g.65865  ORF g.65865 m.65865 type:complete len:458 (+) comp9789_c0_seq3:87-1460(+)
MAQEMGGWTMRTGRTVRHERSKGDSWVFRKVLLPILAAIVLVGIPWGLYSAEWYYKHLALAFNELDDAVIHLGTLEPNALLPLSNRPVHYSSNYTASVADTPFGVALDHALKLDRQTEYCQWQEWSSESCETCRGENDQEYKCNCVTTYHYDKGWRSHRIISLGFDQPVNHHNPQRDPYPSTSITATDVQTANVRLEADILNNLRAPTRKVFFSPTTTEHKSWFFPDASPRNEGIFGLNSYLSTSAYTQHNFVYTDKDGWFFSPYERGQFESLFRRLGQFIEGSLFDFQIGDIFHSCTAGDIRVRYRVADPKDVSVIGLVRGDRPPSIGLIDGLRSTPLAVGFVHAGEHTYDEMVQSENAAAHTSCLWWRLGALLWGFAAERLYASQRAQNSASMAPICGPHVVGGALFLIGVTWTMTSGLSDWSGSSTSFWTVVSLVLGGALLFGKQGHQCDKKQQ